MAKKSNRRIGKGDQRRMSLQKKHVDNLHKEVIAKKKKEAKESKQASKKEGILGKVLGKVLGN